MTQTLLIWRRAVLLALAATIISILQNTMFGGLPRNGPFIASAAAFALPWFSWAALAPLIVLLVREYPLDLANAKRTVPIYIAAGILVVAVKLLITAPITALLIWRPLHVDFISGVSWLFAHRSGDNLLIFATIISGLTAYRYFKLINTPETATVDLLTRVPVRNGAQTGFVDVAKLMMVEAEGPQLVLHSTDGRHTARTSLQDLERRLPAAHFLRIHRSRIINLAHVDAVEPWGRGDFVFIMRNGERVVSGKTFRDAIRKTLSIT